MKRTLLQFNNQLILSFFVAIACVSMNASAYQVLTSTCKTPNTVLSNLDQWDTVANKTEGLNINFAPGQKNKPDKNQWKEILAHYKQASTNTFCPWGCPDGPISEKTVADFVDKKFKRAKEWGYTPKYIMLYHHRGEDGKINSWQWNDVTMIRKWLDANGHSDIKLMYNARSYKSRKLLEHPDIDAALNEGQTSYWFTNKAGRHELLRWATSTPGVKEKPFFFQITVHHDFEGNPYESVRSMICFISVDILGSTDWVRTDNAVFLPMTYPDYPDGFPFLPETTENGSQYGNSMTGLLCSLIEQKDLFEGRNGTFITKDQCGSFKRAEKSKNRIDSMSSSI